MTTIERTAYPRFKKTVSKRELNTTYTPTPAEIAFVQKHAYGLQSQFNLLVSLKCFQRLGFFPAPTDIPAVVIKHIRPFYRTQEKSNV